MKKLLSLSLIAVLCLGLVGCNQKVEKEADDLKVAVQEEIEDIEKEVVETVKKDETLAKEDIEKAISYIQENIHNIKDSTVAKNLVKAGTYLEHLGKNLVDDATVAEHDLVKLGQEAKTHATKYLTATEDEIENVLEEGKELFKTWEDKLSKDKDALVDEFHKLIHK